VVTLAQLRDLNAGQWQAAAVEWGAKADHLIGQAKVVRDKVLHPLKDAWTGSGGEQAQRDLRHLMELLEVDTIEYRAISLVLHGCAHAFQIEQSSLRTALATAAKGEFTVTDDGVVHLPTNPMVRHDPDYHQWARGQQGRLQKLVDDALAQATKTDHAVYDEFVKLAGRTDQTSVDDALATDLGGASRLEVQLIADTVPSGTKDQIADWWASLTDDDRKTLIGAVPWALEPLDGIPPEVKAGLHGDGDFDRAGVAGWARNHWDQNTDDPFGDNCTNFVSNSLEGAGLPDHLGLGGMQDPGTWGKDEQYGGGWLDAYDWSHSRSWAQAQDSYDFWTQPGHGTEVAPGDVRPGDIIYFEQTEPGYAIPVGTVHHAAVVTSVVDGQIFYTQHSSNQLDASLDGRNPVNALNGGFNHAHVVRPDPNWGDGITTGGGESW
jgi:hypothetical protein